MKFKKKKSKSMFMLY